MTETPKSIPPENIFGTAKKMHLELEKLNIVDHGAVINMLNTMAQHREMSGKLERQVAEQKARDEAMAEAQKAHEKREAEQMMRQANSGAIGKSVATPELLAAVRDGKEHGSLILVP